MNFLVCSVPWTSDGGSPACTGALSTATAEEVQALIAPTLSWEDVADLQGQTIVLFALVFGFLALKKTLK